MAALCAKAGTFKLRVSASYHLLRHTRRKNPLLGSDTAIIWGCQRTVSQMKAAETNSSEGHAEISPRSHAARGPIRVLVLLPPACNWYWMLDHGCDRASRRWATGGTKEKQPHFIGSFSVAEERP